MGNRGGFPGGKVVDEGALGLAHVCLGKDPGNLKFDQMLFPAIVQLEKVSKQKQAKPGEERTTNVPGTRRDS